ncbi:MAG: nuclear transport factor 2 family protein [Candidatus Nanopelagicales bacterium]
MSNLLKQAHDDLYTSLNIMLTGDAAPVLAVWSPADDISYAGPFGEFSLGRDAVVAEFETQAARHLQGELAVSKVQFVEGTDLGYSMCVEHGTNHIIDGQTVNLQHRATNIFRKEADGWHLVHHHTDSSGTD